MKLNLEPIDKSIVGGLAALTFAEGLLLYHGINEGLSLQQRFGADLVFYSIGAAIGAHYSLMKDAKDGIKITHKKYFPVFANCFIPLAYGLSKLLEF